MTRASRYPLYLHNKQPLMAKIWRVQKMTGEKKFEWTETAYKRAKGDESALLVNASVVKSIELEYTAGEV